jgi:hypothetical protein
MSTLVIGISMCEGSLLNRKSQCIDRLCQRLDASLEIIDLHLHSINSSISGFYFHLDSLNIRINSVGGSCYNSFQMITKSFILPPYDRSLIRLFCITSTPLEDMISRLVHKQ